jgi:hypothetical protein
MKRIAILSGLVSIFFLALVFVGQPLAPQVSAAPAAASAPATFPATAPAIPIGYDTTRIMAPLKADGSVDYVAALNEKYSKGVTNETNAAVILVGAFDPDRFFAKGTGQKVLEALGVAKPEKPEYFKDFFIDGKPVVSGSEKFYETAQVEPWKSEDNPEVAQWLKDNDAPLDKIVEASKLSKYFMPMIAPAGQQQVPCLTPGLVQMRNAGKALMIRANMAIGDGKFADAWRDITAAYRLGTLYGQQPLLIDRIAGLSLVSMSLKTTENFANADKLPRGQAKSRLNGFISAQFPAVPDAIASIETGERFSTLSALASRFRDITADPPIVKGALTMDGLEKVSPDFFAKAFGAASLPDLAKQTNDYYDQMVKAMSLSTYGQQVAEFKKFSDQAATLKSELVKGKYLQSDDPALLTTWANDYLVFSTLTWCPKVQLATYRVATQKKLVTIALALAAYKTDKGKYPSGLTELTTETTIGKSAIKIWPYLTPKTLPMDFFTEKSDKPFVYKADGKGYTLYSVGENMKDDGGKDQEHGGDDIVIRKT